MKKSIRRFETSLVALSLVSVSLAMSGCTSTKTKSAEDPVAASAEAPKTEETTGVVDASLPPELQDAHKFDPATTIDQETLKNSDFYQVKREVEVSKSALDAEWKAQDALEQSVIKAKEDEEKRKALEQAKEDEAKEEARLKATKDYEANQQKRMKEEQEAMRKVATMPTISEKDVNWNGLE
jgi:hypothetical protein